MKFKTLEVCGMEQAIAGMRNPLKSYARADSEKDYSGFCNNMSFILGENDRKLATNLWKAGTEHRKWLRMVQVWVDIEAPRYFWSEFDTYKIGTTANSESTMHKLKDERLDCSCVEFDWGASKIADTAMLDTLCTLRNLQQMMKDAAPEDKDKYHRLMKGLLPEGFIQKRTVNLNYETLANMYHQRKNHRLPQWSKDFVNWVETLPYSEFITGKFDK